MMADHPHTIDRWDDTTGETLIEQIAAVGDYMVALETYRAAVKRWPKDKITLRNRARVIGEELAGLLRWRALLPKQRPGPTLAMFDDSRTQNDDLPF